MRKSVIIADAKKDKKQELFESFGGFVNDLNGKYITAEDVGDSMICRGILIILWER